MSPTQRRIAAVRLVAQIDQDLAAARDLARDRRNSLRDRRAAGHGACFRKSLKHAERVLANLDAG